MHIKIHHNKYYNALYSLGSVAHEGKPLHIIECSRMHPNRK
jgi:hypothetical protein